MNYREAVEQLATLSNRSVDEAHQMANLAMVAFGSRYCATCGEREGSEYAKHCCTDDNMLED